MQLGGCPLLGVHAKQQLLDESPVMIASPTLGIETIAGLSRAKYNSVFLPCTRWGTIALGELRG